MQTDCGMTTMPCQPDDWQIPENTPALSEGDVHVWLVQIDLDVVSTAAL